MKDYDPFNDAMTPEPDFFYGQVHVEAFQGFFSKGQRGATPYDENAHGPDQKHYLIIEFTFTPLNPQRQIFSISTVKWASEFNQVLRPSLETCAEQIAVIKRLIVGQFNPLREVNAMWVKCERVPRPDNAEDETWTTMSFLKVYATEAECTAAFEAETGQSATPEPIPFETPPSDVDPERAALAAFLPAMWEHAKAQADEEATRPLYMAQLLNDNRMLAKHFTLESPEVKEIMTK